MELYYSLSILLIIATCFAWLNERFLKMPTTIGIMMVTMIFSVLLVFIESFEPEPLKDIYSLITNINFTQLLMGGMLYFLLFAGAIQINISDLEEQRTSILVFSTLSVVLATFVVGFGLYGILNILLPMAGVDMELSLIYCLLFGALISPTDAVAVLGILKKANVPKPLETKVTGEALFNDGVAVILFTLLFNIAQGKEQLVDITFVSVCWLLVKEIFGALLVGLALGGLAFYAMKTAYDYKLTVLITLSVVVGGFMMSQFMEISGPLTMVFAGLVIGNVGRRYSREKHVDLTFMKTFWELVDEILNAVLFLLIGFEFLLIPDLNHYWLIGFIAIPVVLLARYISIKVPTLLIPFGEKFSHYTFLVLVWGGLRGGVSIALALSIGDTAHRNYIVAVTYFVVVFSIVVQGLTIGKVARRFSPSSPSG